MPIEATSIHKFITKHEGEISTVKRVNPAEIKIKTIGITNIRKVAQWNILSQFISQKITKD